MKYPNNLSKLIALPLTLLILLAITPDALAHRPFWDDKEAEIIKIPELSTSFALYRDIETPEQVDVYELEATAGQELYAGINIPAITGLEDYTVTIALVGPELPPASEDAAIPYDIPADLGVIIFPSQTSEDFYEPFTQTNYWGRQRIQMDFPASGTYYLLIWNPDQHTGKYVLDTGRAEVFGPADILRFPVWWVRVHAYFGHTPYMLAGLLPALILIAGLAYRRRVAKQQRLTHTTPATAPGD